MTSSRRSRASASLLGRISAVFLTGEAAVGLLGAVAGPFLAQAIHLTGLALVASLVTLIAAALTRLTVPKPVPAETALPAFTWEDPGSREDPVHRDAPKAP